LNRIVVVSGLLVTSLVASACAIDTAALLAEEAEESPSSLRSFSTDLKTAQGMEYQVTFGVSPISIEREDLAPNQSVVTATLKAELGITNQTEGFAAEIDVDDLEALAFLPSLEFDEQEIEQRARGVGREVSFRLCDGLFELAEFTLDPGEDKVCAGEATVEFPNLTPEQADKATIELTGQFPVAVSVDGSGVNWANAVDARGDDLVVGNRAADCGSVIGRWLSGGPYCQRPGGLPGAFASDIPFADVVGEQPYPSMNVSKIDANNSTHFTVQARDQFFDAVDLRLDLVERLPEECEVARDEADAEVSNVWRLNRPVVFLMSDPGSRAGLAFDEGVELPDDPVSINESLVERGLWVPFGFLRNPDFNPRKKVKEGNLPYAMPKSIPADWTYVRRHYAPRVVELGNEAALKTEQTTAASCFVEIRTIMIEKEKEQERYREERERDRDNWRPGTGGGGSFNIPGWLCPTRWC